MNGILRRPRLTLDDMRSGLESHGGRRTLSRSCVCGALVAMLLAGCSGCSSFLTRQVGPVVYPSADFTLPNHSCTLALTIDDAPDPDGRTTAAIAQVLRQHGATATFFVIGNRVNDATRPLLEQLLEDGNELGNHGFDDARAIGLAPADFEASVAMTHAALLTIADAAGVLPPVWFRPGWGLYNRRMLRVVSSQPYGYRVALADVLPLDTEHCSVARTSEFLVSHVRPGSIIVLHDADNNGVLDGTESRPCENGLRGDRTVAVLREALPELAAHGYSVASLSAAAAAPPAPDTGCAAASTAAANVVP